MSKTDYRRRMRHLAELDNQYQTARDNLVKEYARGHLISWNNNFMRLDRFMSRKPANCDEETYAFLLGNCVQECADFEESHINQPADLAMILIDLEQCLNAKIFSIAYQFNGNIGTVHDAICVVARHGQLCLIIDYISLLEAQVQS